MCAINDDGSACKFEAKTEATTNKPIRDKEGYCLFHSRDIAWKQASGFEKALMDLARQQIGDASSRSVDLSGAVLDESVNKLWPLDIGTHKLKLDNCEIQADVIIEDVNLSNALSFKETTVVGEVSIKNVNLNGVDFEGINILGGLFLRDVTSISYFLLDKSSVGGSLNFNKVTFKNLLSILDSTLNADPSYQRYTSIDNCTFDNMVEFKGSTIKNAFVFKDSTINNDFIFQNVDFECYASNQNNSAVHIAKNSISSNASLKFIGLTNAKIFDHAVDVTLTFETIAGELFFENCNLQKIHSDYRYEIIEASRDNTSGIIIGDGCLKYRVQSPVKTIPANAVTENIIRELSASFANYFLASNGFNLGVEFVSKQIHEIKLFYYTDENIDQVEFNRRLQITEEEYWGFSIAETALVSEQQMTGLIDTYISKLSLLAKIKLRQESGLWNEENMQNVLQAISFGDTLPIAPKEVNLYIENLKINKGLTIEKQNNFGGSQQFGDNIINT